MASSKRFISGAVCPRCQAVDKIYTLETDGILSRYCNRCDFSEALDTDPSATANAAPDPKKAPASEWQPVKFDK